MAELIIGYVTKPHGLKGDVVVHLVTNRAERMTPGTEFRTDRGPMRLQTAAFMSPDRWRVHFDGVDTREGAESLHRLELRAEPLDDPEALWVHELVGSTVTLPDGTAVGTVDSVMSNPASDLLLLDTGALVPLVFVVSAADGVVVIDPPAGLLEVNDPS